MWSNIRQVYILKLMISGQRPYVLQHVPRKKELNITEIKKLAVQAVLGDNLEINNSVYCCIYMQG